MPADIGTSNYAANSLWNRYVERGVTAPFAGNPTKNLKQALVRMQQRKMMELITHRFKWKGLPEGVNERFLEMALYYNALVVFFKHPDYNPSLMAWKGSMYGLVNYQDDPTEFLVTGNIQEQIRRLDAKECVPVWSNYSRVPDFDIVQYYSALLVEHDVSIRQLVINSRRPVILVADEAGRNRLSLTNLYKDIEEGQPSVGWFQGALDGTTINDMIQALDMKVDTSSLADIEISKTRIFNECMTFFGIDNANQDKKERLVADEVDANNSQVMIFRKTYLDSRQQACELINKMFGTNMSCEWNEELDTSEVGLGEKPQGGKDDNNV